MHMRKRSLCVLATIALAISTVTVGCGGSASSSQTQQQEATEPTTEETQAADAGQNEAEAPAETEAAPQADAAAQPEATAATEPAAQPEATAATEPAAQPEATAAAEPAAKPAPAPAPAPEPEPELPRSPLTGKVMDEELLKQRPLAVMYPINQQAQPQYGLDRVDVFYEIMEEGSMSRQMGIMQDWQGLDRIGNIRSIRSYFVYEALEWDPIIIHFGGPVDWVADDLTREDVDNINGVGGVMGPDYGAFYRIPHDGVAIEHTAYTDSEHINDAIEEAGFEREHREGYYKDKHFTFAKDGEVNTLEQYPDAVDATEIDMAGSYPVTKSALYYNPDDHLYYKTLYGEDQCDGATGEQLSFTNIFIQRCDWVHCAEGTSKYLWFRIEEPRPGIDDGFYITNGKMIHVTWDKAGDYEPTIYYDDNGNEVTVNQGRTMVFIIRDDTDDFDINSITYYPDDHKTLTEADVAESSDEGSTEEAASEEEPAGESLDTEETEW